VKELEDFSNGSGDWEKRRYRPCRLQGSLIRGVCRARAAILVVSNLSELHLSSTSADISKEATTTGQVAVTGRRKKPRAPDDTLNGPEDTVRKVDPATLEA